MREIQFRIWDSKFKKYIMNPSSIIINASNGKIKGAHGGPGYVDYWQLEQYTGFIDKNGKEIYEGDIIGIDNIEQKYYVKWEDGAFYLFHTQFKDWNNQPLKWGLLSRAFEADMIKFGKISVIGNIHQNK